MRRHLLLIIILLLAAVLRVSFLDKFPAGLNADEAALGYNAYSLLLTGKDEHGHSWPVNLESFGDFKPALYAYILIPFVKFFGLTELAVRLPSAIFGILAVLFIYLLVKELITQNCAQITALLLTISPWHLHFSRGGWEVNVATTLMLIGIWGFVKWLKTSKFLWLGIWVLGFVVSMYTYQSARLIAPLFGLGLGILYFRELIKFPKQVLIAGLILIACLTPLIVSIIKTDATSRLSGVGLLADEGPLNRAKELRGQYTNPNSFVARVFHNRPVLYTIAFLKNYTDHFYGDFLFINGDIIERNRIPETGVLYLTDLALVVLGLVYLIRHPNKYHKIIWLWLLIAPMASALTFQTPNAVRAQNMVIPLTILTSTGLWFIKEYPFRLERILLFGLFGGLIAIYGWQVTRYMHEYYVHYSQTYPVAWEAGFKEVVPYVESAKSRYEKILITDKYDQPYILFLFYSKYPPQLFQNNHQLTFRDKFNFSTVRDYDKYHFAPTSWEKVRDIHSSLIVAAPEDIPDVGVNIVKTINFPNGQPAFKIISN